jgi:hypothetical protein
MKWKPGLRILLNLPKNSTVLTVLGVTILIDNATKIISNTIANTIAPPFPEARVAIGTSINNIGTNKRNMYL